MVSCIEVIATFVNGDTSQYLPYISDEPYGSVRSMTTEIDSGQLTGSWSGSIGTYREDYNEGSCSGVKVNLTLLALDYPAGTSYPGQGLVPLVHVDKTSQDAVEGAKFDLGLLADELLKGRFRVIPVRRPLKPVYKDPFAVADARSVPEEDLIRTKVVFPEREGSTINVTHSPSHRFHYRYVQTPDLVTLFKGYDSKPGVGRRNPHSASVNPETVDYAGRESVEVRTHVFHGPEQKYLVP